MIVWTLLLHVIQFLVLGPLTCYLISYSSNILLASFIQFLKQTSIIYHVPPLAVQALQAAEFGFLQLNGMMWGILSRLYLDFCFKPLITIYMAGPRLLGFWAGQSQSTICAMLTDVPAEHWMVHLDTCEELLRARIHSYVLLGLFVLVAMLCYQYSQYMIYQRIFRDMLYSRLLNNGSIEKNKMFMN